ncbi:MAG TPA: hypothetical protein ENI79_01355 [Rhodospirillales bacterium]|nr:hypothetical protein [Rhodospirillales bacterium]
MDVIRTAIALICMLGAVAMFLRSENAAAVERAIALHAKDIGHAGIREQHDRLASRVDLLRRDFTDFKIEVSNEP